MIKINKMYQYFFLISIFFSTVFSYKFDFRSSRNLQINWINDPNIDYSFDLNEYCLSKCLKNKYIYIKWDESIIDYYDYLQTAVNTLYKNGGGSLYLEDGIYLLSNQIEISSNTCILGESKDNTILKLQNFASPFAVSGLLRSLAQENITISDITLDGNKKYQNIDLISTYGRYGIYTEVNNYSFFNNVRVQNFQGYGFDPHGNKIDWAKYLVISECESINNDFDGITIDQTDFITLLYNNATKNYRHGINIVTGSTKGLIINNYLYNNGFDSLTGCGITIQNNFDYGTSDWEIKKNYVTNNALEEICIRDSKNINILDNIIVNNNINSDIYCIAIDNNNNINILNNNCTASNFIRDKNNTNLLVENNIFSNINIDSNNDSPDPYCKLGIIDGLSCCYNKCNMCGGLNCSKDKYGADFCCSSTILSSNRFCDQYSAPCIIKNNLTNYPIFSPTISPTIEQTNVPTIEQTIVPTIEQTNISSIKQTTAPTTDIRSSSISFTPNYIQIIILLITLIAIIVF